MDGDWIPEGWTVVAFHEAIGDDEHISASRRVRGNSTFDVGFACADGGQITFTVYDAQAPTGSAGRTIASFQGSCGPSVRLFTGPGPERGTVLGVVVDQATTDDFWAQLIVPRTDIRR